MRTGFTVVIILLLPQFVESVRRQWKPAQNWITRQLHVRRVKNEK